MNENDKKRKGRGIGILAGSLLMILAFTGFLGSSVPKGRMADLFDLPTLLCLLGFKFLILSFSGRFHDYLRAWRICLPGKMLPERELESAIQAVRYAGALSLTLGGVVSSVGLFSLLNYLEDFRLLLIGNALAQITLTFFYTAIEETIYIILLFRMKRMLENEERR